MNGTALLVLLMESRTRVQRYFAVMRYQRSIGLCFVLALFAGACKKEDEPKAPSVVIVSPTSGTDVSVPDTLQVVVEVNGEDPVDQVTFTLTNADGIPVGASVSVVPATDPARIEVGIPLTSDLLVGGEHILTVKALSGEAQGKDQRNVDLISAPLRLRRVIVISTPQPDQVSIHVIDSLGAVSLANTLVMDLGGAVVCSARQVFALMGIEQGPLMVLAPDGQHVGWQKPNEGSAGIPWFTSLDRGSDERMYVGTTDGYLRGYNASTGVPEYVSEISDGFRTQRVLRQSHRVLQAQANGLGTQYRMVISQASSGAFITEQLLDKQVVEMFARDDSHVLIFGNRNGQGVVEDRNTDVGGGWEPRIWASAITAVEGIDANTFLVALTNGTLERFTYTNAGSVLTGSPGSITDLAFEPVSGTVYAGAGNEVLRIDPQSGSTISSYPIGVPVRYVLPLLNR